MIKPIKTVTAYETADGQTFQTLAQAQEWQARLEFADYVNRGNQLFLDGTVYGEVVKTEALRDWLLDNRTAVLELLNAQRKG